MQLKDKETMIIAKNDKARDYLGLSENLDIALEHITEEFFSSLGDERVDIIPGQLWCTKFSYETISEEESFFEAHEKFLDIHIMLDGSERVEIASPSGLNQFDSQVENDFYAYRGKGEHSLILSPGSFLVVFPDDAHKIKMHLGKPETVTKAVFKVRLN